jgi:hypothetical protein
LSGIALLVFLLSLATDMNKGLSVFLTLAVLVAVLDKMSKGIVLREVIALHASLTCLVMPVVGYTVYNRENDLANLFRRYMRVPEDVYFSFALPATALFIAALCWPIRERGMVIDEGPGLQQSLQRIRSALSAHYRQGLILVFSGMLITFITPFLPAGLTFFADLFFYAAFSGILYVYFSPTFKGKGLVMTLFLLFLLSGALRSGMFTVLAYMGATIFSFFLVGKKYPLAGKVAVFAGSLMLVLVLQSMKGTYRRYVWNKNFAGDQTSLFVNLFVENLQKGEALFDKRAFYQVHIRLNQGFNLSLVMNRIPNIKPHDGGQALMLSMASALVPRLFWPDKPEAGGKFNMLYYAGWRLYGGFSTNVGPLGEAYGAFGVPGGIFFMFLLGLFIRWVYARMFRLARNLPLLILWMPVLFYQTTYSAETDTLQIMNSLIKTAFFMWLLYKLFPRLFGASRIESQVSYRNKTYPA